MADVRVAIQQSAAPDFYVDNEQQTNDQGQSVIRQKVSTPDAVGLLEMCVHLLGLLVANQGTADVNDRVRVNIEAGTLPTVTTVTTVSSVTNAQSIGGVDMRSLLQVMHAQGDRDLTLNTIQVS